MINKFHPLQLSFLLFSMLLNCMGIIILKYSGSSISYQHLGILEFFKDIPIAVTSFFCVGFINKIGTKISLQCSLLIVFFCSTIIPFINDFWFFKIWFVLIGIAFSIGKIAVFGLIRNNVENEAGLSKVMNRVEASFVIGVFGINMLFGWLLASEYEVYWKFGFWSIALIAAYTIIELRRYTYKEVKVESKSVLFDFKSLFKTNNPIFFTIIFFLVLAEQCFNSWLPTFYRNNLGVNSFYALQSTAFLAFFSFIGRFVTSKIIQHFSWFRYIMFCLLGLTILIVTAQILITTATENTWLILMAIFPFFGLFLSPTYPLYNSKFLINTCKEKVNILTSLIVIFSSLGSSFGSLGMSYVFEYKWDHYFLLFVLAPVSIVVLITIIFRQRLILRQ